MLSNDLALDGGRAQETQDDKDEVDQQVIHARRGNVMKTVDGRLLCVRRVYRLVRCEKYHTNLFVQVETWS